MKLGKVTVGDKDTYIVIRGQMQEWITIHIHGRVESVEQKGTTLEVKMRE